MKVGDRMSTLKTIAECLGVSYSTVSRSFDPKSRVGPETRKRVLDYAAEINFQPNLIARSLKKNETKTVGIIIPSLENIFYIDVLQHIEIALKSYGYRLLVSFVQHGFTTELECLELMKASQVDALIFMPTSRDSKDYILRLSKECYVIQLFTLFYDEVDSLIMNDVGGAFLGADFLFKQRHRRVLYIGGPDRVEGFIRAAKKNAIPADEVCIKDDWNITHKETMRTIQDFKPTAIFAIAYMAETAWRAIRSSKMDIPDDISLIVYDDTKWINVLDITAVAHDLKLLSEILVEHIMLKLRSPDNILPQPQKIVLEPFIIKRNSVKKL